MELEFSQQIVEKYSNIKFHDNPSSRSPVVTCGHADRRTDTMKLTVAIRNFANEPNMFILNAKVLPNSEQ
jgi:hypothetical protein